MTRSLPILAVLALAVTAPAQEPATAEVPFPASTALAEGISPEALAGLAGLVQSLVDDEEIVGAELLIIKNGHSILHEAYGWADREAEVPMKTGSVFCVRSMTKPFVGTAILMLIDDDALELDGPVSEYLPAFDVDGKREITVEQLLQHTSGLPMSLILGKDLQALDGIAEVAALGGGCELEFEPGTAFNYSDQGTDTLTALIEVASGMPAAEFVRTRILEPLGMHDSTCVMTEGHPLRERGLAKYAGSRGSWTRFWGPEKPELFPFFLGSQGLYSTLEDYARFLEFWRRKGKVGKERLLGARFVRKALEPGPYTFKGPTGLPGLRTDYGFLMQLWTGEDDEGEREVVALGHTGSDGTHAWLFPEEKAMALYFTQSRGTTTGLRVEEALGDLFLGVPYDANKAAPPFEQYLGYYWEGEGDLYRAIVRDGDDLALEVLGKVVVPLSYIGEDRWKMRPNPSIVLEFQRSEAGEVTGYRIGDHEEFRFEPSPELPSVDEVAAKVAATHRVDLLETLGPMRMSGRIDIEKLGIEGEVSSLLAWPDRFRFEGLVGDDFERLAFDGKEVHYASKMHPAGTLEGPRAESLRLDNVFARFGDWRRWYPTVQVIQRIDESDGDVAMIVRMGDTSGPATTLFVNWEHGFVGQQDSMVHLDGLGRIGQRASFGDFRDVSGMQLPFRTEVRLANPMIGTVVTTIDDYELGVELADDAFVLEE